MTGQRWLLAIATLFVVMAFLVFGWLGLAQVEQRTNALHEALTAQKLRVAPFFENARIVSSIVSSELQLALRTSPVSSQGGRERVIESPGMTEYFYDRPQSLRKAERELSGSLLLKGSAVRGSEVSRLRYVLQWLFDRDLALIGQSWSTALERTYYISRDASTVLTVPAWSYPNAPDQRAQRMLTPFPGDIKNGEHQLLSAPAWIDPSDGKARRTIVAPLFDVKGAWLGNAGIDFLLAPLDQALASSSLEGVEWLLVDARNEVLALSVRSGGEFSDLIWGSPVAKSRVKLPNAEDGARSETGRYTIVVHAVPGSTNFLYGIVPSTWVIQDLPLVAGVGGTVIVLLIVAFSFIAWLQRRNERAVRLSTAQVEAQVAFDRARRDRESDIKDYLAEVATRLHQVTTREDFAQVVLTSATSFVHAEYGAFYLLEGSQDLLPGAGHGVTLAELTKVKVGQGLLGEAAKSRKPLRLNGSEAKGFRVSWGQGPLTPVRVDLLPVAQNDALLGVLVLAFLQTSSEDHQDFYDALLPTVANNLEIQKRNLATVAQAKALERQQGILKETEAWSRGIIESSPDGMLVVDANGTILMTNQQVELIFGYASGEMIGQSIESLVPGSIRPRHSLLREGFMNSPSQAAQMGLGSRDLRAVRKDGSEIRVEVSLTKLPELADSGTCVCTWVRPILTS